jgi:hypothetical protein
VSFFMTVLSRASCSDRFVSKIVVTMSRNDSVHSDAGLHSRERVVALEPSTGSREALSASLADGRCQWLQPGLPVTWSVHVEVSPAT